MKSIPYSTLIDTIRPDQVAAFLKRKGWRQLDYPNRALTVWEGHVPSIGDEVSVVLPAHAGFADYPAKLLDCVRLLAQYYEQPMEVIIHHVVHWDRDMLRLRIESPLSNEQLLPLDYASQVISKYKDFVAFAASAENNPKRFFAKLTGAGKEFIDKCMFGHTFVGSFGLTIVLSDNYNYRLTTIKIPEA